MTTSRAVPIYVETGKKQTVVGAIDWPGWCRVERTEELALQRLIDVAPRYARIMKMADLPFHAPADPAATQVVERLQGSGSTDFGIPAVAPATDDAPLKAADLRRSQAILTALWAAFDAAVASAEGKTLRTGPRGGGRDVERMIEHVLGGDVGYLRSLGWPSPVIDGVEPRTALTRVRQEIRAAVDAAAAGEIEPIGPRGSRRWPVRYYIRRAAWHVLDHAWEIEDRLMP